MTVYNVAEVNVERITYSLGTHYQFEKEKKLRTHSSE